MKPQRGSAVVPNVDVDGAKVVFVLESPHIEEVAHGYPAAGATGRTMSAHLLGRSDIPFGLVARERRLVDVLKLARDVPYSIMNVSREPLQAVAYTMNGLSTPAGIDARTELRDSLVRNGTLSTVHRDDRLNQLKQELYSQFRAECRKLQDKTVVVPCGKFARAFTHSLLAERGFAAKLELFPYDLPHPARRGWNSVSPSIVTSLRQLLA
jgi:hypothetical protein